MHIPVLDFFGKGGEKISDVSEARRAFLRAQYPSLSTSRSLRRALFLQIIGSLHTCRSDLTSVPMISERGTFFDVVWHSERSLAIVELDELPCIFAQCPSATRGDTDWLTNHLFTGFVLRLSGFSRSNSCQEDLSFTSFKAKTARILKTVGAR